MVGLEEVLQQIPLAVTTEPIDEVMFPPLAAVVFVIDVMLTVVSSGKSEEAVNVT